MAGVEPAVRRTPPARQPHRGPEVVAPINKVNVALPFSQLHVQEASAELVALAAIVGELATLVEGLAPGDDAHQLRERAEALAARLR